MAKEAVPRIVNPVREQDRAEDLLDNWRKYGYVMFPQQRAIYQSIASCIDDKMTLEVGCGSGQGSGVLECDHIGWFRATDSNPRNVEFAKCLYPWIDFQVWDIMEPRPWKSQADAVVAIEVIEHVADARVALRNLIDAVKPGGTLWISTPNGTGKPKPPSNPFHVEEFTPAEVHRMVMEITSIRMIEILEWETFKPAEIGTLVDPLVYKVGL